MAMRPCYTLFALVLALYSQLSLADQYSDTRKVFEQAGQSSAFFAQSYGYALFPSIGKGGFGIGGAYGDGKVFVGGSAVATTNVAQLSIGFQLGGQVFSQVIFF